MEKTIKFNNTKIVMIVLFILYWVFTFIKTHDYENWFVENLLVFIFIAFFIWQHQFAKQLSTFSFACLFFFVMMHISGSQFAYTHHPIGEWMKTLFGLQRNMYDRIVHFSFGLLIAVPLKEFIIQKTTINSKLAFTLSMLWICTMAMVFELIEWIVGGVIFPDTGTDYVGTQGDVWDPQKDMALAIVGAFIILHVHAFFFKRRKETV